jgi:tetratricopeptide (TPR) repeat protein
MEACRNGLQEALGPRTESIILHRVPAMPNVASLDLIYAIDEAIALKRYAEAEPHCRTLIRRRKVTDTVVSRFSVILARLGKWDEALLWFRFAALSAPDQAQAAANLAHAYETLTQVELASQLYHWSHLLSPSDQNIAERHGDAATQAGQLDRAFSAYLAAFADTPITAKNAYKLFDTLRLLRAKATTPVFFASAVRPRIALVTAADAGYAPYLRGMIETLMRHAGPHPPAICVLDLGLDQASLAWLTMLSATVVQPGWDIDFPDRDTTPETFKAMTARPFLPKHFPGYDLYLWMDADTWVQDPRWLDDFLLSALLGRLAVVPEISPAYLRQYQTLADNGKRVDEQTWRRRAYALCYDESTGEALAERPTLNSGVFALRADAPHWRVWQQSLNQALAKVRYPLVEQTAFNHAVYTKRLLTALLPATANWQTHRRLPFIDPRTGLLCEPYPPHEPLGIIHVTGPEKQRRHTLLRLDGIQVSRSMLYEAQNS